MDQDLASQKTALLRNGFSLKGREKPNRMFIFCKEKKKKSRPPRLRIDINFMGLWAVRSSRFLAAFPSPVGFYKLGLRQETRTKVSGLSVSSQSSSGPPVPGLLLSERQVRMARNGDLSPPKTANHKDN